MPNHIHHAVACLGQDIAQSFIKDNSDQRNETITQKNCFSLRLYQSNQFDIYDIRLAAFVS